MESIQSLVKAGLPLFDTEHASQLSNVDVFVCTKGIIKCESLYAHLNLFLRYVAEQIRICECSTCFGCERCTCDW